ncbi:MAG TPA: HAMP domain-containing sensor histidine kinase [Syntrophorhabdaceae bacterium]|nr:HAMP domain-containing sensor histidine kinase [Syntrophorhabdaceae bacterium]
MFGKRKYAGEPNGEGNRNLMKSGKKGFFRDPSNLNYNLRTIVPVIVLLTSLLSLAIGSNILAPVKTRMLWVWIGTACLFSGFCSFIIMRAMTQPISDLVRKAEQYVKLEEMRKKRGKMIEVYSVIDRLIEYIRLKADESEKNVLLSGIENLDYIIPLGYMSLMVAHEVRNPLATITGMSELLKQKATDESQRQYLDTMLNAARKIDIFTTELLDLNDNELMVEEFDLNDVVDEAIRSLSQEMQGLTCTFEKERKFLCTLDRTKMYQVIFNILKNASYYEKENGLISVRIREEKGDLFISIYNRHSKIDEENLRSLFKPFFTKRKGGKGFGLFIAMRNIKLHGGDIRVESGDEGTTFIIELPLERHVNTNGGEAVKERP